MRRKIGAVMIAGALAVGLAACGGDDDDDEPTAEQVYCGDLAQLEDNATTLLSTDPTTLSIDDVQQARETISDDLNAVADSAEAVDEEQIGEVQDAWQNLEEGIDDLSGDDTLGEALTALAPDASAFLTSLQNLDSVDCDQVEAVTTEE